MNETEEGGGFRGHSEEVENDLLFLTDQKSRDGLFKNKIPPLLLSVLHLPFRME